MFPQSEGDFRKLAENAHDGIVILSKDGRVAWANKRACEITGYCQDELIAADFRDVVQRDGKGNAAQRYQMMIAGKPEPSCTETRLVHKRGKMLWGELSVSETVWNNHPAVLVIFRDITERKCTEEALINSCAKLECRIGKRDLALKKTVRELERKCEELSLLKIEGEKINNELLETNHALTILARNIKEHHQEADKAVAGTINSKIMPMIDNLQKMDKLDNIQSGLVVLCAHLQILVKELMGEIDTLANLTPSEVRSPP